MISSTELSNTSRSIHGYYRTQEIESTNYLQYHDKKRQLKKLQEKKQVFLHPNTNTNAPQSNVTFHEINKLFVAFFLPDNELM
jgi:hypothetical protein